MRTKLYVLLIAALLAAAAAPSAIASAQNEGQEEEVSQTVQRFKGKVTYRIYCSNCHGESGHGDGKLAELLTAEPADLTAIARNNGGEFPTDLVTRLVDGRETVKGHGLKEMPVWGDAFQKTLVASWTEESDEVRAQRKIDEVVAFIGSIQVLEAPAE